MASKTPELDSVNECKACFNNRVCCPPVLMTIGCGHCGTSTMHDMLLSTSLFYASSGGKESEYFDTRNKLTQLTEYLQLFPRPANSTRFALDLTPGIGRCQAHSAATAANVRRLLPNMKFLVFIRDPADWLLSFSYCSTNRAFAQWFNRLQRGSCYQIEGVLQGLPEGVCPFYQIEEWMHHFPPSRFLFISFESFVQYPEEHILDVLEFLGMGNRAKNVHSLPHKSHYVGGQLHREPMTCNMRKKIEPIACPSTVLLRRRLGLEDADDFVRNGQSDCVAQPTCLNWPDVLSTNTSWSKMIPKVMLPGCGHPTCPHGPNRNVTNPTNFPTNHFKHTVLV